MIRLLSRYWQYVLLAVLVTLPLVALVVLGFVWLIQAEWLLNGLLVMAAFSVLSWLLIASIRSKRAAMQPPEGDARWSPDEEYAWRRVCEVAKDAESAPPVDVEGVQKLVNMVAHEVAQSLHGKSEFVWASFSVPELLGALQDASARTRRYVSQRVPGAQSIHAADLLALYGFYDKHQKAFRLAYLGYRVFRAFKNLPLAISAEVKGLAQGQAMNSTQGFLKGLAARILVEELGRVAINLYGGRYRMEVQDARQRLVDAAPEVSGPVPIRILLAGQTNAGKSSLANALLGSVKSPVSELPTPGGVREFRTRLGDQLDLTLVDSPGLDGGARNISTLTECCEDADLILWVAQANNPARNLDLEALRQVRQQLDSARHRRAPNIVLVLTHVDRLSPLREWMPPYDLEAQGNAKAANIRQALDHVTSVLNLQQTAAIPVALREGEAAYNLEAVWSTIGSQLNQSQLIALDRVLKEGSVLGVGTVVRQLYDGSKYVAGKSWESFRGKKATLD